MDPQALSSFLEILITRAMMFAIRLKSKRNASTEGISMAENTPGRLHCSGVWRGRLLNDLVPNTYALRLGDIEYVGSVTMFCH